ncbi:hypothetical protein HD553DRAFT_313624 [Filobasidium floriforme]|uniref:uncharacterized protein n=1 Tax=Filobasidium floriforme TaxID=5210 RepID=UPI001E8D60BE|nr:uncharacterized protein HD553DRAFT_313624 [Filobasidium floriforme]KAH8083269.1 hypothetical protein HD553DRAFT_313624 [Filobasidium floriforme]
MLTNARWNRPSSRVVGCGVLAAVCVSLVYLGQVQDPYWTAGRTSQIDPDSLGAEDHGSAGSWLEGLEVLPAKPEDVDESSAGIDTEPDPWELVPTVDFSTAPDREYKEETEARLRSLAECMDSGRCPKNRQSVAILASLPCYMTVYHDYMGGEGIWCRAMIKSLERQGYTVLYARDDWSYVDEVYRRIPDQVKVVIGDDMVRADKIFRTPEDPAALPAWKTIVMWFFPVVGRSPVGNPWHISAEPGPEHWNATFIGYDMTCPGTPIPTSDRNNQVYILAKRLKYFYDISPAWNVTFFPRAALELSADFPGFEFVAGYKDEDEPTKMGFPGGMAYPEGVRNLGRLSPEEFARHVKESKALLGIGSPPQSPSPYHALCQGVPFINPVVLSHEDRDAMDPANWKSAQHSTVARLPEPYNYAAVAWDYDSFVRAIRSALTHSTPRYRFDHMASESLDARMDELMNRDWFGMAQEVKRLRDLGEDKSFSKDKIFHL